MMLEGRGLREEGRWKRADGRRKNPQKENVEYANFDESLWILLQNKEWRTRLREYIIEHKLTDGFWNGKRMAEGLGVLAALLMVA